MTISNFVVGVEEWHCRADVVIGDLKTEVVLRVVKLDCFVSRLTTCEEKSRGRRRVARDRDPGIFNNGELPNQTPKLSR